MQEWDLDGDQLCGLEEPMRMDARYQICIICHLSRSTVLLAACFSAPDRHRLLLQQHGEDDVGAAEGLADPGQ